MSLEEIEQQYFTRVHIRNLFAEVQKIYESSLPDTDERARVAYLMGVYYHPTREKALDYYAEARRIAVKAGNKRLRSDLLNKDGNYAMRAGDLKRVNELERQALSLATEAEHPYGIACACYMLAHVAIRFGLREEGIEYLGQSLRVSKEHGILKWQERIFAFLSELYTRSQECAIGREYGLEAVRIARELGMEHDLHENLLHLAGVELALKKYATVMEIVAAVRNMLPEDERGLWSGTHGLTAEVHTAKRRYKQAESEFRTALSIADYPYPEKDRSGLHAGLAKLYLETERPEQALEEGFAALADAEKSLDSGSRKDALNLLHTIYKEQGDYKHAHEYLERANALIAESDTQLLKSRLEYHALKNDYEVEQVKLETQAKESELLRLRLEHKDRELSDKVRHLVKQAETLRQFQSDLRALIRRTPADDPAAKEIRSRLAAFPEPELNWQEFEQEFAEAHPDFLPRLSKRFPDLTQMETRVAAMVQMDLKSSDIAQLFSITERAVEFHRLNLRKKLQLKKGDQLNTVLAQLS